MAQHTLNSAVVEALHVLSRSAIREKDGFKKLQKLQFLLAVHNFNGFFHRLFTSTTIVELLGHGITPHFNGSAPSIHQPLIINLYIHQHRKIVNHYFLSEIYQTSIWSVACPNFPPTMQRSLHRFLFFFLTV